MTDGSVSQTTVPALSNDSRKESDKPASFRLPGTLDNPAAAACVVGFVTLVIYCQILGFSFTNYDDITNVTSNPYFNPVTARSIRYLWTHGYNELYMPVTYTVWAACAYLGPLTKPIYVPGGGDVFISPILFHGVSLFLHTANALLVFALLNRLVKQSWPACVGALLFALHPLQVEPVAWVTGMNNLTSGFFGLLALWFYLAAAEGTTAKPRLSYGLATVFFVLALLSKPTATAIPLIAAVIDSIFYRRRPAQWLRALAPWVLMAVGLAIITRFTSQTTQNMHLALWVRPFIAADALAFYLAKLVFPLKLGVNFGRSMAVVQSSWWGYVTWLVPATVTVILWRKGRTQRPLITGTAVFVAAIVPMLGFVPYYTMEITTVSGRFLYLALFGAGLVLAWFVGNPRVPTAIRVGFSAALLLFFSALTLKQLPYWSDTYKLAAAQIAINPEDAASQSNYGIVLASTGHPAEAIPYFRAAVRIKPANSTYQYHLGTALEDSGDIPSALPAFREAVRLEPRFLLAQIRLGGVLLKLGQNAAAMEPLNTAAALSPNDLSARYLLGIALAGTGQYKEAEAQFRRVLSLSNTMPQAKQALARVLEKQGRRTEAAQVYGEILKSAPDDAEARQGLQRAAAPPASAGTKK